MYEMLGEQACLHLVDRLTIGSPERAEPMTSAVRKRLYNDFLERSEGIPRSTSARPQWTLDCTVERLLLGRVERDSQLNDNAYYREPDFLVSRLARREEVDADISQIERLRPQLRATAPRFWHLFDTVINHIVLPESPIRTRGGTSSRAIGVIYLCEPTRQSISDLYEFFVHELTHTMIFIFELSFSLYDYDRIAIPENYCIASLTRRKRPLDKVFHSLIVATELLLHRIRGYTPTEALYYHGDSSFLLDGINDSIRSVYDHPLAEQLLTPGAWWLLDRVERCLPHIKAGLVER